MPTTRRRRIVRRAVMAVAAVVVLVVAYTDGCLCIDWCVARGTLPRPLMTMANVIRVPRDRYCQSNLPGAEWLNDQRMAWTLKGITERLQSNDN